MAFGDTGVLDNFNRANEGPPPSSSWTDVTNGLQVSSNQCIGNAAAINLSYWNVSTFGPDSESFFTLITEPTTTNRIVASGVRLTDFGNSGDGYIAGYQFRTTTDRKIIARLDNGAATLLTNANEDGAANDKFGCEAISSTIKLFEDTGSGWSERLSTTDSTYTAAGNVGMRIDGNVGVIDDFGGGTVGAADPEANLVGGKLVKGGLLQGYLVK